ncbi:MAG TPA: 16S rRNA (cytosine(967)-C(5))-methyltransferase RsmB [Longimicrobiaceae bacterium]|nr:16S rRNA (cytosine(967)-C(5))-methyltransferase RsmB [Longimicrobiaceae bacterium]
MPAPVTAPRQVALTVVRAVREGDLLDRALARQSTALDTRGRAWVRELLYGVYRLRGRLDSRLAPRVHGGLDSLQPDVLDVLRLGAYQLLEMGGVPPYAAISQSVELARWAGVGRAAGLVNGVLNAVQRRRDEPLPAATDLLSHLTTWGSHPAWLVERWLARFGPEETRALVEADNSRPGLCLRPVGVSTTEALERLRAAGIEAEAVSISPDSVRVISPAPVDEILAAVPAVVQDPAAALVVRYAAPPRGAVVLDLCAAPGGKALGLAERAGLVVAADLSAGRLRRLGENVDRLGLGGRVAPVVADARWPPFRPADVVLVDAPCTGTGTLRRHPDGRWRVQPEDLAALAALQREILDAAAPLVRPGGYLVYSTCSLEPEENATQVEDFLARHPGFEPAPEHGSVDVSVLDGRGFLRVLPQRHAVDGAFAARLRRSA